MASWAGTAKQDPYDPDKVTHRMILLSERSRHKVHEIHCATRLPKKYIIEHGLASIDIETCVQNLNKYVMIPFKQRKYQVWIPIETYQTVIALAHHFDAPIGAITDSTFHFLTPEKIWECYVKINNQRLLEAKRNNLSSSQLLQQRRKRLKK